jgi:hypothetical protein
VKRAYRERLAELRGADSARIAAVLAGAPGCGLTRYVAACRCLDDGLPAAAARHFMLAHHAECELESASLLAFACLLHSGKRSQPFIETLRTTWEEFRRPAFDRTPTETAILDALADASRPAGLAAPLAEFWRLPSRVLREQIRSQAAATIRGAAAATA